MLLILLRFLTLLTSPTSANMHPCQRHRHQCSCVVVPSLSSGNLSTLVPSIRGIPKTDLNFVITVICSPTILFNALDFIIFAFNAFRHWWYRITTMAPPHTNPHTLYHLTLRTKTTPTLATSHPPLNWAVSRKRALYCTVCGCHASNSARTTPVWQNMTALQLHRAEFWVNEQTNVERCGDRRRQAPVTQITNFNLTQAKDRHLIFITPVIISLAILHTTCRGKTNLCLSRLYMHKNRESYIRAHRVLVPQVVIGGGV